MLEILPEEAYRRTPWKNGNGVTEDILLLPTGASHEDFDIRISRASIVSEAPFSAFPGIDRTITRLSENALILNFADGSEMPLDHLAPCRFDSALAPTPRLPAGDARVMNVMTRRGRWRGRVRTLRGPATEILTVPRNGLVVVHAVGEVSTVEGSAVGPGQTLIVRDTARAEMVVRAGGAGLVAFIEPEA